MIYYKISAMLVLSLLLASCSALVPMPTPTPIETPLPMSIATDAPLLKLPTGTPVKEWNGIPIMSGALAGDGHNEKYTFTIAASVAEVQAYYEKELAALGWYLITREMSNSQGVELICTKNAFVLPISIIRQRDVTLVVIIYSHSQ